MRTTLGTDGIRTEAEGLRAQLLRWRRHLHQHPEPSFQETETAAFIVGELEAMGLRPTRPLPNAVSVDIGPAGGRRVALRADIDALPIQEETGLPYASTRAGLMHACGHDGHTAILLGIARLFASRADRLPGQVRLLFQPAEEVPPGGAEPMIAAGVLEGVSAIAGLHLWATLPSGQAVATPGPAWAAADRFRAVFHGRSAHGAQPHRAIDALEAACRAVGALQTIVSRRVDPVQTAVVSVGTLHAGEAFNIIAGHAALEGTVRAFDERIRRQIRDAVGDILRQTAAAAGATVDLDYTDGYPPLVNDPEVAARAHRIASEILGSGAVHAGPLEMAADDFGRFLQVVPGCYLTLGAGGPDPERGFPHHHPRFTIDEGVLPSGVAILAGVAVEMLTAS